MAENSDWVHLLVVQFNHALAAVHDARAEVFEVVCAALTILLDNLALFAFSVLAQLSGRLP